MTSLREKARALSPNTWALIAIFVAVLAANGLYLLGVFDPNPLGPRSGLLSASTPGALAGQPTIDPNIGFVSQALGHRAMLDWVHGIVPWWNPYEGTGMPLASEMQAAAFFPPALLTVFANGQIYERILLELIAGWSTFLLLRRLSVNPLAAAAAGIAFALNGTFAWFAHATANPVAFLPLLLLGIELAYDASAEARRGGWWLIAVAGALSFLAGFPEVTYVNVLMAMCWFAWRCWRLRGAQLRAFARKAAAGATVGTLLSAPLLLAFVDYLAHADVGIHAHSLSGTRLIAPGLSQLVLPYVFGPIFAYSDSAGRLFTLWGSVGGYLTTSLVVFALLGAFSGRGRRGLRILLAGWVVVALSRMYGQPPVIGDLLSLLPGMSSVAFFRYATDTLELAVVLLAAFGLDGLMTMAPARRRHLVAGAVTLAVVIAAAIGAVSLVDKLGVNNHRGYAVGSVIWGAAVAAAAILVFFVRDPRRRAWLASCLVAVDAFALFVVAEPSAPRSVSIDTAPVAYLQRHLGISRFFTLGPAAPNYGSYFGIASLNANDVPIPSAFKTFVHARLDQIVDPLVFVGNYGGGRSIFQSSPTQQLERNLDGYRDAAVAYVLTPAGTSLPQSPRTFTLVSSSPSAWVYRLAGAQPYFTAGGCTASEGSRSSTRLTCPTPTTLVRRETSMPGWSAQVDGHDTPIRMSDGIFQSVAVGAGEHRVTFSFTPPHEGLAFAGFALGLVWLLTPALRRPLRRRNETAATAPAR